LVLLFLYCPFVAAQEARDPFDEALEAAISHPMQWDETTHRFTANSREAKIEMFEKIIREHGNHPRLLDAKLAEFRLLARLDEWDYLVKADRLIREIISDASVETPLGREARLAFVYFLANATRQPPFEEDDFALAATVLNEMEVGLDPMSIERARWIEHKAKLLVEEGKSVEALTTLVEYYRETYEWPKEMWETMIADDPAHYEKWQKAFRELNWEVCKAIASTDDPQIFAILRDAPLGIFVDTDVYDTWKRFEERYFTDGKTYEELLDSMTQTTLESIWEDAAKGTPTTSRNQPSAGADSMAAPAGSAATTNDNRNSIGWPVGVSAAALALIGVVALWILSRRRTKSSPDRR